jgi:ABC-type glycerol-3-phosphate transport system permease component
LCGKDALMLFMLGSMTIPPGLLLAPLYKMVGDLGVVDSLASPCRAWVRTYVRRVFRGGRRASPFRTRCWMWRASTARGEIAIYFRVVMPLVRAMAALFCLVAFLANWNAFFSPNVFLHSEDNLTCRWC